MFRGIVACSWLVRVLWYSGAMSNIKNLLLGPTKAEVKIVGVSNYTAVVARLTEGAVVRVEHEPTNPHDPNAMRVTLDGETVGYIPRMIAERIVNETSDRAFEAHIKFTTHHDGQTVGGGLVFDKVLDSVTAQATPKVTPAPMLDRPVF